MGLGRGKQRERGKGSFPLSLFSLFPKPISPCTRVTVKGQILHVVLTHHLTPLHGATNDLKAQDLTPLHRATNDHVETLDLTPLHRATNDHVEALI